MMTTLTGVLEKLRLRKQDNEFEVSEEGFKSPAGKMYQPDDLTIIETYHFEGESDPSDNAILYLIETNDGLIGYSIDAYGAYANGMENWYSEFIKKIPAGERAKEE
ncbi:hypothetical protein [Ferruginibacter profundus]